MNIPVPAHIQPFTDALGEEGAERFLLHFGGSEVHWPAEFKTRSRIVEVMGRDAAAALAAVAERLQKRVPTGKPWLARRMKAKGLTVAAIARELHTTDVTIRKYLEDMPRNPAPKDDPRQRRLL